MVHRLLAIFLILALSACSRDEEHPAADEGMSPLKDLGASESPDAKLAGGRLQQPARGLPEGSLRVEPGIIVDYTGFEQPMAASTLFVPSGWRTQGGVEWGNQHMCTNGYAFNWSAISPDGSMSIAVIPQHGWSSNNYGAAPSNPGCRNEPYTNVRQYLEALVQYYKPGARVVDFHTRDDLRRDFAHLDKTTPMPLGELRQWVETGEILVAFDENGRDMRGTIAAVVMFNLSRTNAGMGEMVVLNAYAFPAWATTAPDGRLNTGLFEALRRSIKANPEWERRISGHNTAIARTAQEETRKRAQILAQSNEEIARIREQAWTSSQESADRRAREFGELIRGVETYKDADAPGGTVELSHDYDNAWRLNDGSYVLTNDPSFEPWRDMQLEGRRLDPAR